MKKIKVKLNPKYTGKFGHKHFTDFNEKELPIGIERDIECGNCLMTLRLVALEIFNKSAPSFRVLSKWTRAEKNPLEYIKISDARYTTIPAMRRYILEPDHGSNYLQEDYGEYNKIDVKADLIDYKKPPIGTPCYVNNMRPVINAPKREYNYVRWGNTKYDFLQLDIVLSLRGVSWMDVSSELKYGKNTIKKWIKGKEIPHETDFVAICNKYRIPIAEIITLYETTFTEHETAW